MLVGSGPLPTTPATLQIASGGTISGTGTISANVVFSSSSNSTYNGAIVDAAGASHSLTLNGSTGTLALGGTSTYSGGTTIGAGILNINSDAALGAVPLSPSSNIAFNGAGPGGTLQFATGFAGGLLAANRSITVNAASAGTIDTNGNNVTWGGALVDSGTFAKLGAGTMDIGRLTLGDSSALGVQGGTLRLNVGTASTIGSGVTAAIAAGATLELAGSTSALSAGTSRVNVINNGSSMGLLVSGIQQQVGGIDGLGTTQINAGSDLTANHIVQSALVINGSAGSLGLATIAPSGPTGNPLDQSEVASNVAIIADVTTSSDGFGTGLLTSASPNRFASQDNLAMSFGTPPVSRLDVSSAVPEPTTTTLLVIGIAGSGAATMLRRRRKRLHP
jgi:autotransporter-associated beta strand protein